MVSIFVGPVYFIIQYFIWTAVYGSRVKVTRHPEEGTPHLILLSGEAERRPGSERAS
jgi:hypothetical protein